MTTDILENAIAFARADVHEGDPRVIAAQAKAACRTLLKEVERLGELENAAVEYVCADDALGGRVDTWTIEAVEKFDTTEKRFYALCRETAKARST